MSTTSRRAAGFALVLALGACIQGPWDYYPDPPPQFFGVFATGYVLSGRPLENICFERALEIEEEHTQAFPWYDSADVQVSGGFSGTSRALKLVPHPDSANCFRGDSSLLAERGGDYALSAVFAWDSAGTRVVTRLSATAHVPDSFSVHKTAAAPRFAISGGVPGNILDIDTAFILKLPPMVRYTLNVEYGDSLLRLQGDTAKLNDYVRRNGKAFLNRLKELLLDDYEQYSEGDTLYYLNSGLNTLPHYFSSDRSPDVGAVLITQRFDPEGARPETRFDRPLGLEPDSGEYYFPGNLRRLIIYPDAKGAKGWNLLDSMGVVNTWFHTRLNRLYFYGFEKAYYSYNSTATGENDDPRVKPKYNVTGAAGIFVGAIPDSFDVNIRVDTLAGQGPETRAKAYDLPAVHAFACRKDGWSSSRDCREYYPVYCKAHSWLPPECAIDAIRICLDTAAARDTALGTLCDSIAAPARADSAAAAIGALMHCIEKGFPEGPACAPARKECLETKGVNICKQGHWSYCLDHLWKPIETCGPALASYCHDKPRLSETLCRHADEWCAAHADSPLCH